MRQLIVIFLVLTFGLSAVQGQITNKANQPVKLLSLQECVQLTLEHNFDIRIERYNPTISKLSLEGLYGSYDPILDVTAEHTFNSSPGGIIPGTEIPRPSSQQEANI